MNKKTRGATASLFRETSKVIESLIDDIYGQRHDSGFDSSFDSQVYSHKRETYQGLEERIDTLRLLIKATNFNLDEVRKDLQYAKKLREED